MDTRVSLCRSDRKTEAWKEEMRGAWEVLEVWGAE